MTIGRPARRRARGIVTVMLIAVATAAAAGDPSPRRIVSANLCADRLVLQLADRENVVSVSRFAADPEVSTVAPQAAGIRVNQAQVEDIVSLRPDLVLMGAFGSPTTTAMLRALGITVHELARAESIAAVRSAIRSLASSLGLPERGERMVADMEASLAALPRRGHPIRAAVYQAGGWSAGRGTLADDLFGRVGFVNIAAEAGIVGFGALPLERLVASAPDLVVFEATGEGAPSIATELLHHPALARSGARMLGVPMRLWACPDPALVEAAALIIGAAP